ncbi:MAG: AbrB/MazE/SpoVT family DNA-binding domain-containing protein [Oscillospiraceae bacterium]|nr:AbrB/MazE/SpoVT family DNA-binding domain-containing protein [Oscillospiraceae bacterium]
MLVEVRSRSQITLPSGIIKKLGISEGDKFEVVERDGGVFLCPVVVYPKKRLDELSKIIKEYKANPSEIYDGVEELLKTLDISTQDKENV